MKSLHSALNLAGITNIQVRANSIFQMSNTVKFIQFLYKFFTQIVHQSNKKNVRQKIKYIVHHFYISFDKKFIQKLSKWYG